ncbi:hypothetical protein PUNSTDRAFT_109977 [Punctularia strigosozonata HHB-11173 SS5]|uniref:uncharacterized protein n=1 Tax=Punctularia strigosozonata (strain HHB-11173) TaxID=741275 RepID=UPI0004416AD8|nr:uncharacterized protein PUNSTDRAFT_109977 [Punctularia strigosozonata HHB-11173 SS5]EIN13802.1 hypothetical protein PUNSTDRAFT_109977 [Punctularia strigosozonata HHB-11173 SS5]
MTGGPRLFWTALSSTAKTSTVLQILLFLPLTLSTLGTAGFLSLSLLLFLHALIHGTLLLVWDYNPALSVMQVPMHSFLLLVCFNTFTETGMGKDWMIVASGWWGKFLSFSSPGFIILEGLSSLLVVQKLGQEGKQLVSEGEDRVQFGLLIGAAVAYVASAWWIVMAYPTAATSPLSSTLLGVALTAFLFLTFIGFGLRRTNIIESAGLSLFLAYNVWLCGFDQKAFTDPASSYAPLLGNIIPHLQTLTNFVSNTLPKPVLIALVYRLTVFHFASHILPAIGADSWDYEGAMDDADTRPTAKVARFMLTYRQAIFVTVYSNLLLLDHSSQIWWRWINIFFTLVIWSIELLVSTDDDIVTKEWKVQ